MKKIIIVLTAALSILLAQSTLWAEEGTAEQKATEVGNKICPISGHEVGGMGEVIQHEYNGKIYNLCCKMCLKDFNKDPEKYGKIAEEEVEKSSMPDSGGEKDTSHDAHGH